MPTPKEQVENAFKVIEDELAEEKIKNNRLSTELISLKNKYARLIEIITEGAEICKTLKT